MPTERFTLRDHYSSARYLRALNMKHRAAKREEQSLY